MTDEAATAMSPVAYLFFQSFTRFYRETMGITSDEMSEFNEWNNPSSDYCY